MASVIDSLDASTVKRRRHWRMLKDRIFAWTMAVGGISVIITIVMIFFYLFYVVAPLFIQPGIAANQTYAAPLASEDIVHLALDEYAEVGFAVGRAGEYVFFDANAGTEIERDSLPAADTHGVVALARAAPVSGAIFLGYDDNSVVVARPEYAISYPNDKRHITPSLELPLGSKPLELGLGTARLRAVAGQVNAEQATIVSLDDDNRLLLTHVSIEESLLGDERSIETNAVALDDIGHPVSYLSVDIDQRELFVASSDGELSYFDIQDKAKPRFVDRVTATGHGVQITTMEFLSGGISLLIGDSSGQITQWFPVRNTENAIALKPVRSFKGFDNAVATITPEYFRKGFLALDSVGTLGVFHTTASRTLLRETIFEHRIERLAINSRADAIIASANNDSIAKYALHNEHPEVSWQALWGKVWYESREHPQQIWQSSSASSDFEPKFSLTPLTFGTIKAAFYAMLFAIPLAILGAIYTAYFMTPSMRGFVKPAVEIMAALPTVILGFLAGLWLAPLIEQYLSGVFVAFVLVPLSFVFSSWLIERLPVSIRNRLPTGWEAALLIPVVCLGIWLAMLASHPIDAMFFEGNLPLWLAENFGITYDQRNSLVVGMAIGFAVIPTIFSISEDAVFGVPRHLTTGSLALGATPWQTVIGVVILTASPGIFSAVMIGLGRAVGETMIVLMATGNTPIMDFNIFQGFRALSANIAVEMPESEVNSTHYRVLFLAALVLFLVTFAVNTVAEIVRQRLRVKYSNL